MATIRGPAKEMHERMINKRDRYRSDGGGGNQIDLNAIVRRVMKGRIKVKALDKDLFPWAGYFFSAG